MSTKKPKTQSKKLKENSELVGASRKLKGSSYKSFKLSKKIRHPHELPSAFTIFRSSIGIIKKNWKLFGGIILIYGLLTIILVKGLSGGLDLGELKDTLSEAFEGVGGSLATTAGLFSLLIVSAGSSNAEGGSVYQALLLVITSLAAIWAIRQVTAGHKARIRDAFYLGMYPLVPFMLVLFVIGLQLIPMLIGSWLYSTVLVNAIAVTTLEKTIWLLLFFLLTMLSLYMLCSSLFAVYIVTLPNMAPLKALRSARQLVLNRRLAVFMKIAFLPVSILLLYALIMFPLILFLTAIAEWVFFILSMTTIVIVHSYMYALYRELLK